MSRGCTQLVKEEKRRKKSPSGLLISYLSAGNDELNLAAGGADDLGELLGDALEYAEAVVLGEGGEEVLDGVVGGGAEGLGQLGDDGVLVGLLQGRGLEDGGQLGVFGVQGTEGAQGLSGRLQRR